MSALMAQTWQDLEIIVVDNGSKDSSVNYLQLHYPQIRLLRLPLNTGFCHAVNLGIQASQSKYVILLNNDTRVMPDFVQALVETMERPGNEDVFSVSSLMLDMWHPELVDDAGDQVCALGWAFARGKGKPVSDYREPEEVFSACGGAAIYRREILDRIGLFDEFHYAYLEDVDIGYRARIYGYRNLYEPAARVLHAGSASSGSRYNRFKVNLTVANNIYVYWKNMPFLQWLLNLPLMILGFLIKGFFFTLKGMGGIYFASGFRGIKRCFAVQAKKHKVRFQWRNLGNYAKIQWLLWKNLTKLG